MGRILGKLLDWLLGDYLQGIDKKNARASIFSGKLLLEKFSLNPKILDILNLPLGISFSHIGKLEIKLCWFGITSKPIEILLDELLIILAPQRVHNIDPVEEAIKLINSIQQECIKQLENASATNDEYQEEPALNQGFFKFLVKILDNIKIKATNIHIRYEDSIELLAGGFTLNEIFINSEIQPKEKEYNDKHSGQIMQDKINKNIEVRDFSFYWCQNEVADNCCEFIQKESHDMNRQFMLSTILKRIESSTLKNSPESFSPIKIKPANGDEPSQINNNDEKISELSIESKHQPVIDDKISNENPEQSEQMPKNIENLNTNEEQKEEFSKCKKINYDNYRIFNVSLCLKFITRLYTKPDKDIDPFYFLSLVLKPFEMRIHNTQYQQWLNTIEYLASLNAKKFHLRHSYIKSEIVPSLREEFRKLFWEYLNELDEIDIKWNTILNNNDEKSIKIKELLKSLPECDLKEVATENILAFIKIKLKNTIAKQKQKKSSFSLFQWPWSNKKDIEKEEEELEKFQEMIDKYFEEDMLKAEKKPTDGYMIQIALEMPKVQIFLQTDMGNQHQEGILLAMDNIKIQYSDYNRFKIASTILLFSITDIEIAYKSKFFGENLWKGLNMLQKFKKFTGSKPIISETPLKEEKINNIFHITFQQLGNKINLKLMDLDDESYDNDEDYPKKESNEFIQIDWRQKYIDEKEYINVKMDIQRTEITYVASSISTLLKFLEPQRIENRNMVNAMIQDECMEAKERVKVRMKRYVEYNSNTLNILINLEPSRIIIPINCTNCDISDLWIINIDHFIVNTLTKSEKLEDEYIYDIFNIKIKDFNIKYYDNIYDIYDQIISNNTPNPINKDLLENLSLDIKLCYLNRENQELFWNKTVMKIYMIIQEININLNSIYVFKLLNTIKYINWMNQAQYQQMIKHQKNKLLMINQGIYNIYIRDTIIPNIRLEWKPYFGILSGFYFYLFANLNDIQIAKKLFLKGVDFIISDTIDGFKHVLMAKNNNLDCMIAFETVEIRNEFIKQIENTHKECMIGHQNFPSLQLVMKEKDKWEMEQVQKVKMQRKDIASTDLMFGFNEINIRFRNHLDNELYTEANINNLQLYYIDKPLDFLLNLRLKSFSLHDKTEQSNEHIFEEKKNHYVITSLPEKIIEGEELPDFIDINVNGFNENHPYFLSNKTKLEADVKLSHVRFEWRQKFLIKLTSCFIQKVNQQKIPEKEEGYIEENQNEIPNLDEDFSEKSIDIKQFRTEEPFVEVIYMKINITLQKFIILFLTPRDLLKLSSINIRNIKTRLIDDNMKRSLEGSIDDIQLLDLFNVHENENDSIYINPIQLFGKYNSQPLFEYKMCQYNQPIKSDKISHNMEADIDINNIKINYWHPIFLRLLNYFTNNISTLTKICSEIEIPQATSKSNIIENHENILTRINNPEYFKINISLNHLKFILQSGLNSKIQFEFSLDKLQIYNSIFNHPAISLLQTYGIKFIYCQAFHIEIFGITFQKIINKIFSRETNLLSKNCSINAIASMILNFEYYSTLFDLKNCGEIQNYFIDCLKIKGKNGNFFLKLSQQDYLDIIECLLLNLSQDDDNKNQLFDEGTDHRIASTQIDTMNVHKSIELNKDDDKIDSSMKNKAKQDQEKEEEEEEEEENKKMNKTKASSPILINCKIESLILLLNDQTVKIPLTKIFCKDIDIDINKTDNDLKTTLMLTNIFGCYYEEIDQIKLIEKNFLGDLDKQALLSHSYLDDQLIDELIYIEKKKHTPEIISNINKIDDIKPNIIISMDMNNEENHLYIQINDIKLLIVFKLFLRLKDFFVQTIEPILEQKEQVNKENQDKGNQTKKFNKDKIIKNICKFSINQAYILIPGYDNTFMIFKSRIDGGLKNIEFGDNIYEINEFEESNTIFVNLEEQEVFIYKIRNAESLNISTYMQISTTSKIQKKNLIFPFSLGFIYSSYVLWDKDKNAQIIKNIINVNLERLVINVSARDILTMYEIYHLFMSQYEECMNYPKFPQIKHIDNNKIPAKTEEQAKKGSFIKEISQHELKISSNGIQIRLLNDFGDFPVPVIDFSVHNFLTNQTFSFIQTKDNIISQGLMIISSSYFNIRASRWEPFIEKWSLYYEFEKRKIKDINEKEVDRLMINLGNPYDELNINISQEMITIISILMNEWNEKISNLNQKPKSKTSISRPIKIFEILQEKDVIEYVSPYAILNNTGYPIEIEPEENSYIDNGPNEALLKSIKVENSRKAVLLMERNIEEIFDSDIDNDIFPKKLLKLKIIHPTLDIITVNGIDISSYGARLIKLKSLKGDELINEYHLVYTIKHQEQKKMIHFSSTILFKNKFGSRIWIELFNNKDNQYSITKYTLEPNQIFSVPFDKFDHKLSIILDDKIGIRSQAYEISKLPNSLPNEIKIGKSNIFIRSIPRTFKTIFYIEPIYILKNCLPLKSQIEFTTEIANHQEKNLQISLETQDSIAINAFQSKEKIFLEMKVGDGLKSARIPFSNTENEIISSYFLDKKKQGKDIEFTWSLFNPCKAISISVFSPILASKTKKMIFYSKTCILDQTKEDLKYFIHEDITHPEKQLTHDITLENSTKLILLDDTIKNFKIKMNKTETKISEEINIEKYREYCIDIFKSEDQIDLLNLSINITSELCDEENFLRTKLITISPRYVFINKSNLNISIHQANRPTIKIFLKSNNRSPFHFTKEADRKLIFIKIIDIEEDECISTWYNSGALDIAAIGDTCFLIQRKDSEEMKYFKINVTQEFATLFLTLEEQEPSHTSYQIMNDFDTLDILAFQVAHTEKNFLIKPKKQLPFAWCDPSDKSLLEIKIISGKEISKEFTIDPNIMNKHELIKVIFSKEEFIITYNVKLNGRQRIIKLGLKAHKNIEIGLANLQILTTFKGIGFSLISTIKKKRIELFYLYLGYMDLIFIENIRTRLIQLRIKSITIDNMIKLDTQYPVMLYPDFLYKDKEYNKKNNFEFFIITKKSKNASQHIPYIINLAIQLSEMSFYLDGNSLIVILEFIRCIQNLINKSIENNIKLEQYLFLSPTDKKNMLDTMQNESLVSWENFNSQQSIEYIYIDKFRINPIKINFTFKNLELPIDNSFVINLLKNVLGRALANFERAPINLKGLYIESLHGTADDIFKQMIKHYYSNIYETVLGVLFSNNLIGNPIRFFEKVSAGVTELLDTSYPNLGESPIESGVDIMANASSLAFKTIGATFDSIHKFTEAFAAGISGMTGDKEFIKKRDIYVSSNQDQNIMGSSYLAFRNIGSGIDSGITGIIKDPVECAQKEGIKGLMKGFLKGAKGLIIKPITGILDGVSKITEGLSNTIALDTGKSINRKRLPRVFYEKDKVFRDYSIEDAWIKRLLIRKNPKYENLIFFESIYLGQDINSPNADNWIFCLLLTLERIFLINLKNGSIVWKIKTTNIDSATEGKHSIDIKLKFTTKSLPGQLIMIPCANTQYKTQLTKKLNSFKEMIEVELS